LSEEITNTMRNCGARTIEELKPEMVGPRGPWVGANQPPWRYHESQQTGKA
jgi:L-lactate dehydrogenase (cytochrome)